MSGSAAKKIGGTTIFLDVPAQRFEPLFSAAVFLTCPSGAPKILFRPKGLQSKQFACFVFKMAKQFVSQVYKCFGLWRLTRPRTEISKVLFKCEWVLHDGVLHWKYTYVNGKTKMKLGCVEATAVFIVIVFWFCL